MSAGADATAVEVNLPADGELVVAAGRARPLGQVRAFLEWVDTGRALTQTGKVRLVDARELVRLLDTGDLPGQQEATARIASSAELPGLTAVVEWAKESRLVRVSRGRRFDDPQSTAVRRAA